MTNEGPEEGEENDPPEVTHAHPVEGDPGEEKILPPALPNRRSDGAEVPWAWTGPPLPGQGRLSEQEDRTWGMLCHLASFAGLLVPTLGNILGPLLVWLIKRNDSPYVDAHGKESLNFQISLSIYLLAGGGILTVFGFLLGFVICLGPLVVAMMGVAVSALVIVGIIYQIVGSVRAKEGNFLRYPMTIRFFR